MPLTGPMAGAGVGHCTNNDTVKGRDAAKEYYVAKRHTVSGVPCRLPMVAGCVRISFHKGLLFLLHKTGSPEESMRSHTHWAAGE